MEGNRTLLTEFVLRGITDHPELQVPLFLVFVFIYVTTMVGNLGLILLIWKDPRLHTPMYLFLRNLAFTDACISSSVTPKMLMKFLNKKDMISLAGSAGTFWFLDPGGWSKTAAVSLYFIFPGICTLSLGITIPDFKLYYRATVLKTAWYWHQNRHVDQWNRIEDPDINPHRYENLIFDKDAKTVKWKKESIFNKWCWHNWMATCRRLQIDPYLSPCTKLKSKWIKDLNINPVTLNLIEEKVGSTLERIGTGHQFLNITPTAQTLSATINQWDCMKLRSFCKAKDTITKTKHQPTEWEKIFTNPTSDRGLISRIYKELKKHDIKTPNSPVEKWAIELNREFTAEEYRMAERHLRKCSTSLLIREMQIKTTLRYHLTPVRMAKIKTLGTVHVGEDVEQEEHFSTVGGNADWYNHYGKQCPSTEEWIRKMWFIYTMEYYAAEKNNDIMKFAGKWMELENVILSECAASVGVMEGNRTLLTEFVLRGITDRPELQVPLFLVFVFIYVTTMVGNLGLIFLIWKDPHLHTPMYLFLGNLAFADACTSSSVTPKILVKILNKNDMISLGYKLRSCLVSVIS
ncbi:hypothetical protein STEG23_006564 [Scotinomys teguina]